MRCESQLRTQSRINVFFVQGGILCVYVCVGKHPGNNLSLGTLGGPRSCSFATPRTYTRRVFSVCMSYLLVVSCCAEILQVHETLQKTRALGGSQWGWFNVRNIGGRGQGYPEAGRAPYNLNLRRSLLATDPSPGSYDTDNVIVATLTAAMCLADKDDHWFERPGHVRQYCCCCQRFQVSASQAPLARARRRLRSPRHAAHNPAQTQAFGADRFVPTGPTGHPVVPS